MVAAGSGTQLAISAIVQKHASIRTDGQPVSFTASAEDVARGYVDISSHSAIEVRGNNSAGLLLEFHLVDALQPVSEVQISGAGGLLRAGSQRATLHVPGQLRGISSNRFNFSYRIFLSPFAQPGTYSWPLRITLTPI